MQCLKHTRITASACEFARKVKSDENKSHEGIIYSSGQQQDNMKHIQTQPYLIRADLILILQNNLKNLIKYLDQCFFFFF